MQNASAQTTNRELALIAVRVLSLLTLLQALYRVDWLMGLAMSLLDDRRPERGPMEWLFAIMLVLPALTMLAAAALLWVKGPWLAGRITGAAAEQTAPAGVDVTTWQAIAIATAGVLLFTWGVADAASGLANWAVLQRPEHVRTFGEEKLPVQALGPALQIVLGLWLILGNRSIARGIVWLRSAAVREA